MNILYWKIKYGWMCAKRIPISILFHPKYCVLITIRRLLFTITRKFVGNSFRSPITGELVYNVQSLVNAYAMHIVREVDGEWIQVLRETPSPIVFDVGSNIGQFSFYAKTFNPACSIYTMDCWPELNNYVEKKNHFECAVYSKSNELINLCKSVYGWTASTDESYYQGGSVQVATRTLDSIWEELGKPEVTLIKIDIDGAEFEALKGAANLLKKTKCVLVETVDLQLIKQLAPNRVWSSSNNFDWCGIMKKEGE